MKAEKSSKTTVSQIVSLQRNKPIDPLAFTHFCDNRATYVPKHRAKAIQPWQKVTDQTSRGFKPESSKQSESVSNFNVKD